MRDVPHVVRQVGPWTLARRVYQQVNDDNLWVWAAALAYSWLFAVFPFLIFLLSLIPLLPASAEGVIRDGLTNGVSEVVPGSGGQEINDSVTKGVDKFFNRPKKWLLFAGLGVAIWTASSGMAMTMQGLDKCYDIKDARPFWKQRLIAIALTVVVAGLILTVLVLLPVLGTIIGWFPEAIPMSWLIGPLRYVVAVGLLLMVLALIYHFGPSMRRRFHLASPGSVFVVAMWLLLGLGFRVYLGGFGAAASYDRTYGAVGGMAILLLLFYVDALVLMIGAEINSEMDFALLGIPSGDTAEQAVVAPKPAEDVDEEDREMAEELLGRRG